MSEDKLRKLTVFDQIVNELSGLFARYVLRKSVDE